MNGSLETLAWESRSRAKHILNVTRSKDSISHFPIYPQFIIESVNSYSTMSLHGQSVGEGVCITSLWALDLHPLEQCH